MKNWIILLLYLSVFSIANAQPALVIDYARFNTPDNNPYIEVYLWVDGTTIHYSENENTFRGNLELTYLIEEKDSIIAYDKFALNTPIYKKGDEIQDLIDVKRIALKEGKYSFDVKVLDKGSDEKVEAKFELKEIAFDKTKVGLSDIQILNNIIPSETEGDFVKNGLELVPNFSKFYGNNSSSISFYTEVYNTTNVLGIEQDLLIEYSVISAASDNVIANLRAFKRVKSAGVIPFANSIGIGDLPSGNYSLLINIRNRENEIIATKKAKFQRSNSNVNVVNNVLAENTFVSEYNNIEELREFIRSTRPISENREINFMDHQLETSKLEFLQRYFLNFWTLRNLNNPEEEWKAYKENVNITQKEFGYGGIKGYQTERGRVYLQYGKPSSNQCRQYDVESYPYCIWHYNKIESLSNRKFVFYSPSLEMLGYQLLHSTMPGEQKNNNWEAILRSKTNGLDNTHEQQDGSILHERARDLFDNPR